jgi:hypothetical protein
MGYYSNLDIENHNREVKTMKHTPGPWEIEGEGQDVVGILAMGHNHFIAKLSGWATEIQDANARLIAAAPDLLEACKVALSIIEAEQEACGIYRAHTEIIRAAIAKATEVL